MKRLALFQPYLFPRVMEKDSLWASVKRADHLSGLRTVQDSPNKRGQTVCKAAAILATSLMDLIKDSFMTKKHLRGRIILHEGFLFKIAGCFINHL